MPSSAHRRLSWARGLLMSALVLTAAGAPAVAGNPAGDAAYRKGQDFEKKENYAEAMQAYRAAAAQGNPLAQLAIGNFYGMAKGVPQNYSEALRWYRLAADQGINEAQNDVGFFYMNGWAVEQDFTQAMAWFRKSADNGNGVAQRNIGFLYFRGWGVAPDRAEAIRWFRKAAENGDKESIEGLKELGEK
jgi:TPR repeat protein